MRETAPPPVRQNPKPSNPITEARQRCLNALSRRQFFKLIVGGSFTEPSKVGELCRIYSQAGVDCLDVAPEPSVLWAVADAFNRFAPDIPRPLVMISLPLDADPHFRKIELNEPACVLCDACVPVCPTDAIALTDSLLIEQPLCYGCGRCVAVCPTNALHLLPLHVEDQLDAVLSNPLVGAVEIHTTHADPYMLKDFLARHGHRLRDKLLSVCLRPDRVPPEQWQAFLQRLLDFSPFPLILQVDGQPMSGSDDPEASRPSLNAAIQAQSFLQTRPCQPQNPFITISGGINPFTAELLKAEEHGFIAGVGMGTMARKAIWGHLDPLTRDAGAEQAAIQAALHIVTLFKQIENPL